MSDRLAAVINPRLSAHEEKVNGPSRLSEAPPASLLARCQAGDGRAFEVLFQQRAPQVYRWAVLLGLRPAEAEDAAQEVLAIAARRIDRCHAEEALTSWLYQTTRRVVANARRLTWWRRWFASPELCDEVAFGHDSPREAGRELEVRRCLAALPPAQAEVLLLMDLEGFTREEAAELLGLRPGTVASRLRLAREAFRARWDLDADGPCTGLSWGKP